MTPTQRTLKECKARGWEAQVVEKFNWVTKRRHDLFGCIDIVAITDRGILGIQATSNLTGGNGSTRLKKILAEPRMLAWLKAGARLEVWAFAKRGPRGKAKRWTLRAVEVTAGDFASQVSP